MQTVAGRAHWVPDPYSVATETEREKCGEFYKVAVRVIVVLCLEPHCTFLWVPTKFIYLDHALKCPLLDN